MFRVLLSSYPYHQRSNEGHRILLNKMVTVERMKSYHIITTKRWIMSSYAKIKRKRIKAQMAEESCLPCSTQEANRKRDKQQREQFHTLKSYSHVSKQVLLAIAQPARNSSTDQCVDEVDTLMIQSPLNSAANQRPILQNRFLVNHSRSLIYSQF